MTAEDVAVRDALLRDCVLQSARYVLLPDHVGKALRTIFSSENLIAHGGN
jgi:hypothetical protein